MKPPTNPVSDAAANEFAAYIEKWQYILNLQDWRIVRLDKRAKDVMAQVSIDTAARLASYRLGKHFGSEAVTAQALESTAVHELLHVLLAEYRDLVLARPGDEIIEGGEHRIVHTLERILVPQK